MIARAAAMTSVFLALACIPGNARAHGRRGLSALVRADNDYSLEQEPKSREKVELPSAVANKVNALVEERIREAGIDGGPCLALANNLGPIYRIAGPSGRFLFVAQVGCSGRDLFFMLYDSKLATVAARPPMIWGRWMLQSGDDAFGPTPGLVRPLARFEDFDGDGRPEIVTQEWAHNGSAYNAIIFRYFEIGKNLELTQVLAVETNLSDLRAGRMVRSIKRIDANRFELDVADIEESGKRVALGHAILTRRNSDAVFEVAEHHPAKKVPERYSWFDRNRYLVVCPDVETMSVAVENAFLRGEQ